MESQLRLIVVLGFLHSLYILPEVIVPISGVHLSENFTYLYSYSGDVLLGISAHIDCGIMVSAILIYPTRNYCGYI